MTSRALSSAMICRVKHLQPRNKTPAPVLLLYVFAALPFQYLFKVGPDTRYAALRLGLWIKQ